MKLDKNSVVVAIIVFVGVVGFWYASSLLNDKKSEEIMMVQEETTEITTETTVEQGVSMAAYITGEVRNPGVYEIENNYRVQDIVKKAGGLTEKADKDNINMAAYIENEEHIIIKSIDDNIDKNQNSIQNNSSKDNSKDNIININTADETELKTLSGIGDAIASNIVEYREKNGPFKSVDEIKNVSRIGNKLFEKIKSRIKV